MSSCRPMACTVDLAASNCRCGVVDADRPAIPHVDATVADVPVCQAVQVASIKRGLKFAQGLLEVRRRNGCVLPSRPGGAPVPVSVQE